MNDFLPYFSIIIPTLNEENYLPNLLKDLTNQKNKNFEVIVVDGGSSDNTKEVVFKFKQKLKLIFHFQNKKNVAHQRNLGAELSKGKYLLFLDADSRIKTNFIQKAFDLINKKKGLVFLPYLEPSKNKPQFKILFEFVNFLIEASQYTGKPFSTGGALIVEKNFFNLIGGYDETLFIAEDHHLIKKAYQYGVKAKVLNELKVRFSLRRLEKEGEFKLFYKYLVASAYYILKGEIRKKIFDYPMGGHNFEKIKKKGASFRDNIEEYLSQIKRIFKF